MRKTLLEESMLGKAVTKMEDGLIDADLGGYVYKKSRYQDRAWIKLETLLCSYGGW